MIQTKHTPGPWENRPYPNQLNRQARIGTNDRTVASVWADNREGEANAHLIAAAPDLLDALAGFAEAYCPTDGSPLSWEECNEAYQVALAVIAKAQGAVA